jgi:hypothetical protein
MSHHSGLLVTERQIGGENYDFKGKDNFFEVLGA